LFGLSAAALAFGFAWLWSTSTAPVGPCPAGLGMTNDAALAAAADPSHPMPDNVGCVMPIPNQAG
jgi:hypothetical protein